MFDAGHGCEKSKYNVMYRKGSGGGRRRIGVLRRGWALEVNKEAHSLILALDPLPGQSLLVRWKKTGVFANPLFLGHDVSRLVAGILVVVIVGRLVRRRYQLLDLAFGNAIVSVFILLSFPFCYQGLEQSRLLRQSMQVVRFACARMCLLKECAYGNI